MKTGKKSGLKTGKPENKRLRSQISSTYEYSGVFKSFESFKSLNLFNLLNFGKVSYNDNAKKSTHL